MQSNNITLSTLLIHKIFEFIDADYHLLIHVNGSTIEDRSKLLSIGLIMRSRCEEYFKNVRHCGFVVMYFSLAFVVKLIKAPFQSFNFDFATNLTQKLKIN